jgi:ribonuclease HI
VQTEIKAKILLTFWRAWHLHNDMVHGKGTASVTGSVKFLLSYSESLGLMHKPETYRVDVKGKGKVFVDNLASRCESASTATSSGNQQRWTAPPVGWVKLNTDAGFCVNTGAASAGIAVRDAEGSVLLTSWRTLRRCGSPEEAEAEACLEGLRLTAEWVRQPTYVESDCLNLIHALRKTAESRSSWEGIITEAKAICRLLPGVYFQHIRREANRVAHELSQFAMTQQQCVVMRLNAPECVKGILEKEAPERASTVIPCNSTLL